MSAARLLALFCISVGVTWLWAEESGTTPIIAMIASADHVWQADEAETFTIVIPGFVTPETLDLMKAKSTCSCLTIVEAPMRFGGGVPGTVRCRLEPVSECGSLTVTAYLIAKRKEGKAAVQMNVSGMVHDIIDWPDSAEVWEVGDVAADVAVEHRWHLGHGGSPRRWERLTVEAVANSIPDLVVTMEDVTPDGSDMVVRWTPKRVCGVVKVPVAWTVWTGERAMAHRPSKTLLFNVAGPARAIPSTLFLGSMSPGVRKTRSVDVEAESGHISPIKRIVCDEPCITVNTEVISQRRIELRVTCDPESMPRHYHGSLDVYFEDGVQLRVPYIGRCFR